MNRVLIVDDERLLAMALKFEFERQGYEVVGIAGNGLKAIELCKSTMPDVVLMDIQMPEMNGVEATRRIMEENPVCVVVLTGYSQFLQPAEQAGAMGYTIKPLQSPQISPLLQAAQRRFSRYQSLRAQTGSNQEALQSWLLVQQAIQKLVDKDDLSEEQAARRLQESATADGSSLLQAAQAYLAKCDS